jgi:hypothetical protein
VYIEIEKKVLLKPSALPLAGVVSLLIVLLLEVEVLFILDMVMINNRRLNNNINK